MDTPPPPERGDDGLRLLRGCLWAVGPSLVLWALAIGLFLLACCNGPT